MKNKGVFFCVIMLVLMMIGVGCSQVKMSTKKTIILSQNTVTDVRVGDVLSVVREEQPREKTFWEMTVGDGDPVEFLVEETHSHKPIIQDNPTDYPKTKIWKFVARETGEYTIVFNIRYFSGESRVILDTVEYPLSILP
ncbi:MAG: protease inhibitor I42 family protein [Deltaproteobacteria bacterium]|nr:protease inhibitor I42 family protein [Candidatus Zymogenaceae bacterium]